VQKPFDNAYLIKKTKNLLHFHTYEKPKGEE